jgi:hypothetical protein
MNAKPRVPAHILRLLADAVKQMDNPPSFAPGQGDRGTFEEGFAHAHGRIDAWQETYIRPNLRQVLSYLEGSCTEHEVRVYGAGDKRRTVIR